MAGRKIARGKKPIGRLLQNRKTVEATGPWCCCMNENAYVEKQKRNLGAFFPLYQLLLLSFSPTVLPTAADHSCCSSVAVL